MLKPKRSSLTLLILLLSRQALAFDPYTIAVGVQTVSNILGGANDIDELAEIGISASELLGDFDTNQETDEEALRQIRRLEDLNQTAKSLGHLNQTANGLFDSDLTRSRSIAQKIRSVREMARVSRQIAILMGVRPKAGERALKVQDTRLNYMILDELISIRRMQFESILETKEKRASYDVALLKVIDEEGRVQKRGLR